MSDVEGLRPIDLRPDHERERVGVINGVTYALERLEPGDKLVVERGGENDDEPPYTVTFRSPRSLRLSG